MISIAEKVDYAPLSKSKEETPLRAIIHLTQNYLLWNEGRVLYATDTSLHVATKLFRENHVGQYSGPADEMHAIRKLLELYEMSPNKITAELLPDTDQDSESFAHVAREMKKHQLRAKMSMLYAAGVHHEILLSCRMHATHDLATTLEKWKGDESVPFLELLI